MGKKLANAISFLLHPIFMPLLGVFVIFNSKVYVADVPWHYQKMVYLMVIVFSVLLPLSFIPLLMFWKSLKDIKMNDRKERFIPMVFTTISFYMAHYFVARIGISDLLSIYTFSISLVSLLVLGISLFYKISIHLAGIGGIVGLIAGLSFIFEVQLVLFMIAALLLSGFVATARLYLKAHKSSEVYSGFLLGFIVIFFSLWMNI